MCGRQLTEGVADQNALYVRFYAGEERADYCGKVVNGLNDRRATKSLNVAKRYVEGNIEIVARLDSLRRSADYQLISRGIPIWPPERPHVGNVECVDFNVIDGRTEANERSVLVRVGEVFERPKPVVPSLVWLEKAKNANNSRMESRSDFLRQIFQSAISSGRTGSKVYPTRQMDLKL